MKRLLYFLLPLTLILAACSKNEFTVTLEQPQGFSPLDIQLAYYASDSRKGWMVYRDIPAALVSAQQLACQTRNPAVCFLYSGTRMLTVFYAQRGDKITVTCRNGFWTAAGNETTDSLSRWQALNRNILEANAYGEINRQVAAYITANPGKTLSAILLYVYYDISRNPQQYSSLRAMLKSDAADTDLLRALGVKPSPPIPAEGPLPPLRLRTLGDSSITVSPSRARATLFLFWNDAGKHHKNAAVIRQTIRRNDDIQLVDVNMQADTLNWRHIIDNDSVRSWHLMWAPGAEQNSALLHYALPGPDFIITADRHGKTLYRGNDPKAAADRAMKAR